MTDVVLIQPGKPRTGSAAESHWSGSRPFSLHFLASHLRSSGHSVAIIDFEQNGLSGEEALGLLARQNAPVFGLTATTQTRFEAISVADSIKRLHPDSLLVVGGVHFTNCAADTLRSVPSIDVVVRGEGELVLTQLLERVIAGQPFFDIGGVSCRKNGEIVHNPLQREAVDLDSIPIFDEFNWEDYPEHLFGVEDTIPAVSIMTSRGCPYRCVFCAKSHSKYRLRSPESITAEITWLRDRLGVCAFNFLDLTFTASAKHVRRVCDALIGSGKPIRWWCESRADIDIDLLDLMRGAGCESIAIGVESGSPAVLKAMKKDASLAQIEAFCRRAVKLGMRVNAYFSYSHPGETLDDVRMTIELAMKLEILGVMINALQPVMVFPGTAIEKIAIERGSLPADFSWTAPYSSPLNAELQQLVGIPIFLDRLSPTELLSVPSMYAERRAIAMKARDAAAMPMGEFLRLGVNALIQRKPSWRLISSVRFWKDLIVRKSKSIHLIQG